MNSVIERYTFRQTSSLLITILLASSIVTLSCSVGALLVEAPTPTPTPLKAIRPTFTFTPNWTPTFTPSPTATVTPTGTPTETPTETPAPTETPEGESEVVEEAPVVEAAPVEPTETPTPEEPTATPAPEFPFKVVYFTHDTGSPGETRITSWIRLDISPGIFRTLDGYQMKVIDPAGVEYLSELSGNGTADSTAPGTGDNHAMNTKLEIQPYTAGTYQVSLIQGGVQVSPETEIVLSSEPRQYVHFDFFRLEQQ